MTISDQQLSAFLDAELPETDMAAVRNLIAADPAISDRLAALAMADTLINQAVTKATNIPMPDELEEMLASESSEMGASSKPDKVVSLSNWRAKKTIFLPMATAASLALVSVLTLSTWWTDNAQTPNWTTIADVLETRLTGDALVTDTGMEVTAQLTFANNQGQYCRQVVVQGNQPGRVYLACRNDGATWEIAAEAAIDSLSANEYAIASGQQALDNKISEMMGSSPLNRAQEQAIIEKQWGAVPEKE